jgi:hypothetical protein
VGNNWAELEMEGRERLMEAARPLEWEKAARIPRKQTREHKGTCEAKEKDGQSNCLQ